MDNILSAFTETKNLEGVKIEPTFGLAPILEGQNGGEIDSEKSISTGKEIIKDKYIAPPTQEGKEYLVSVPGGSIIIAPDSIAKAYGFPVVGLIPLGGDIFSRTRFQYFDPIQFLMGN